MLIKRKKLTVIRSATSASPQIVRESSRAAQLELHNAKQEAKAIKLEAQNVLVEAQKKLKEAEDKASEITSSTNQEAERIKKEVYEETLKKANDEARILKDQAKALLSELFEVKRLTLIQAHKEIINVALDLAEKIIRYQASTDSNLLKTQVIEAIKKATQEADRIKIYVNPNDVKQLSESIPDIEKLFPSGIEIVPLINDSVDPGSCIVETKSGQLDSTFTTQLKVLKGLIEHMEVKEDQIEATTLAGEKSEKKVEEEIQKEASTLSTEEETLKQELLGEEPLIYVENGEAESFPFASKEKIEPAQVVETKVEEDVTPKRKKLAVGDFLERTKEESEELDEELEDFEIEYEDEDKEEEENKETKSILKPKKTQISDIASEIEKNPEWKDLVIGENEEE
ncbi:MAG: hypothetical protein HYY52_08230 [Candidatus Melainabacteria bacterium]|nr:hypothetical protein [Candidatus Melainabacteria bacterium]